MSRTLHSIAALACAVICHTVQAGRSSVTGASDVAQVGDCEVETALARIRPRGEASQHDTSLRLACGIGWDTEVEATAARQRGGDGRSQTLALEAKTTLSERGDGRIGWALAVGVGAERSSGSTWRRNEHSVAVEATVRLGPTWLVEAKLGALRDRLVRRDSLLWAAAVEHALSDLLEVRAEVEGDDRGRPLASLAMKYTVWPDHLKLKLAYGARSGPQAERRANLGLQYEF